MRLVVIWIEIRIFIIIVLVIINNIIVSINSLFNHLFSFSIIIILMLGKVPL